MATSYISEHSAEYYLVPALKKLLETEFEFITPIFPWITRETSKISIRLHKKDFFRILAMFPRRPKLYDAHPSKVFVTINWELEAFKDVGEQYGVPVIAGCPAATDFWELAKCSEFKWLKIGHPALREYLTLLDNLRNYVDSPLLNDDEIIDLVKCSESHNMESFTAFLRESRYVQPRGIYGPQYKPVYFLIKDH